VLGLARSRNNGHQDKRFFLWLAVAALALRLLFVFRFPLIETDGFVYGDLAKNLLQRHIYGLSTPAGPAPIYFRLPGYPLFLAFIFSVFGMEHYTAAMVVQAIVDVGTCFVIADLVRRTVGSGAAKAAFLLAACCPFLANYAGAVLTETLAIFFAAAALDLAVAALQKQRLKFWALCGAALAAGILLRPDGGILLAIIAAYLGYILVRGAPTRHTIAAAALVCAIAALPLVPWTARNWSVFHCFQPLAPRYANDPGEFVPVGFKRWAKTWIIDYSSVDDVLWKVPGEAADPGKLPARAFDSKEQRSRTEQLFAAYNQQLDISPELDTEFAALARERLRHAPLRYYVCLPVLRIAGMWLRPRTELLPLDSHWWRFRQDPHDSAISILWAALNLFFVGAAVLGLWRVSQIRYAGMMLAFVLARSLFLATLENPEPRYTLECYPVVLVFAGALLAPKKDWSR